MSRFDDLTQDEKAVLDHALRGALIDVDHNIEMAKIIKRPLNTSWTDAQKAAINALKTELDYEPTKETATS